MQTIVCIALVYAEGMKKLRETQLNTEQIVSMITHTQRRALRLMQARSAGDHRPKLLHAIERACGIVSTWHAIYERESKGQTSLPCNSPV